MFVHCFNVLIVFTFSPSRFHINIISTITLGSFVFEMKLVDTEISRALYSRSMMCSANVEAVAIDSTGAKGACCTNVA